MTDGNGGGLPEIAGKRVTEDEHGNISLNDLWRLAGEPKTNRPVDWHRSKRAKALQGALNERITENFRNSSKKDAISTYCVAGRGRALDMSALPPKADIRPGAQNVR